MGFLENRVISFYMIYDKNSLKENGLTNAYPLPGNLFSFFSVLTFFVNLKNKSTSHSESDNLYI